MVRSYIAPFAGALVMALGIFTGCQDSATVAPTDSQSASTSVTSDALDKMLIATDAFPLELDDLISSAASVDVPNFSQGPDDRPHGDSAADDSLHGGRPGPDHGGRPGPGHDGRPDDHPHGDSAKGDSGRPAPPLPPLPGDKYGRILAHLGLDSAQREAIHGCYDAYRECAKDPMTTFHSALVDLRTTLKTSMDDLKSQIQSGAITRDSARAQYRQLVADFRTQVMALQTTLNEALSGCETDLVDCIKSNLTADQLAKWDELMQKLGDHPGRPDRKG